MRERLAPIVVAQRVAVDGGEFDPADDALEYEDIELERAVEPLVPTADLATQLAAEDVLRPDLDESDITALKAIRTAACMKRIANRELRILVREYNERGRDAAMARGWPPPDHDAFDEQVVIDCFEIYMSDALCASVRSHFDNESLEALWDAFAVAYEAQGGPQLARFMKLILSLPASEAQEERTIKHLRVLHRRCGSGLGPAADLSRLLKSTCRSLPALRVAAGLTDAREIEDDDG